MKSILAALLRKYGDVYCLSLEQVAEELCADVRTLQNKISRGIFPIPTFKLGRDRHAAIEDVASYLAAQIEAGRRDHETLQRRLGRIP